MISGDTGDVTCQGLMVRVGSAFTRARKPCERPADKKRPNLDDNPVNLAPWGPSRYLLDVENRDASG
jgi:hypothetical protein